MTIWFRLWLWFVWHLPKRLVYWAAIRLMTAGEGSEPLPELLWLGQAAAQQSRPCIEALRAWSELGG